MMRSKSAYIKAGIAGILAIGIMAITHLVGYRITRTSVTLEEGEGARESPQPTTIVLQDAEKTKRRGAQTGSEQRPAPRSKPKPKTKPSPAGDRLSDEGRLRIEDLPPGFQQQISEAAEFAEKLPEIEREMRRLNPHLDTAERLRYELKESHRTFSQAEEERIQKVWDDWRNANPENESKQHQWYIANQIESYLEALNDPEYAQLVEDPLGRGLARKVCEYMIHEIEQGAWMSTDGVDLGIREPSTLGEFREMLNDLDSQLKSLPANEEAYRPLPEELEKELRRVSLSFAKRRILDYYEGSSVPEDVSQALKKHEFRLKLIGMQLKERTPMEVVELRNLLRRNDLFKSWFPSQFLSRPPDFGLED